jgi:hypothetical protein
LFVYWGLPNLRVVNRDAHRAKCAAEAEERMQVKRATADERGIAAK